MRVSAGRVDKSGSTLADYLRDVDMGGAGPGAPPLPGGASQWSNEMISLRLARPKTAYALITQHLTNADELKIVGEGTVYFQDGLATLRMLDSKYDTPLKLTEVRALETAWDDISFEKDTGFTETSVVDKEGESRRIQ